MAEEHLDETRRHNQKQESQYENDKQRQCHQVFKTSMYEQFKNINPDRAPNACRWVLSNPQYTEWLRRSKDDLVWISADPGCGKSVLSKSLIDHEFHSINTNTICYFFFKDNEDQNRLATALCALLHQLFASRSHLLRYAMSAWEKNGDKLQSEVGELWRILLAAATDPVAGNVLCVLDALDECQPQDRKLLIQNLLKFYAASSRVRSNGTLKFLVTSRPYDDIELGFKEIPPSLPAVRLSGEMENDKIREEIDLVIRERVAKLAQDNQLSPRTKQNLEQRLLAMEHRTYLWLHLAIEGIQDLYRNSLQPDTELIESLPSSVEDAYEKILCKVDSKHTKTVTTLLHMIVGARRPLTTAEMAVAFGMYSCPNATVFEDVNVDQDRLERRIRHLCGLFVFINHSRIYLIHQTAREFLLKRDGIHEGHPGWRHCLDPIESESIMVRACVQYLSLFQSLQENKKPYDRPSIRYDSTYEMSKGNSITTDWRKTNPIDLQVFLEYSAEHWPGHFRMVHIDIKNLLMTKACRLYRGEKEIYALWFNVLWTALRPYDNKPNMDNIETAAFNGHEGVLELLLETEQRNMKRDQRDSTALYWAAEQGHEAAVKLLLERGVEVNAQGGHYGNALQAASAGGHEKIVELLLSQGADINAQGGFYDNALQAASVRGHEKIVELLLGQGAEVNAQGGSYGNTLQAASARGYKKIVKLLLSQDVEINA